VLRSVTNARVPEPDSFQPSGPRRILIEFSMALKGLRLIGGSRAGPSTRSTLIRVDSRSVPNPAEPTRNDGSRGRGFIVRGERERILLALAQVAAEHGYEGTTIDGVAAAAGVSRAEFEAHFPDREACFLAAYEAMSDVLVACVSAAFKRSEGLPWAEQATAALHDLVALLAANAELARMPIVEVTAIPGDARDSYREALDRFVPFLEQGRSASGQGSELPEQTARFAIGGASSLIFDEFRAGRGAELEAILPDLVFAVTMPYLGVEAAEVEMRKASLLN
jgi:AcrR family transcriptional regulator